MIKLYNDDVCEYVNACKNEIIENLKNDDAEINDTNIYNYAYSDMQFYYDELKNGVRAFDNLKGNKKILVVASLGLWYGRKEAKRIFNNLQDILFKCFEDVNALYFEKKNSTLTLRATHHDGENFFKFYVLDHGKKYAITYDDMLRGF